MPSNLFSISFIPSRRLTLRSVLKLLKVDSNIMSSKIFCLDFFLKIVLHYLYGSSLIAISDKMSITNKSINEAKAINA